VKGHKGTPKSRRMRGENLESDMGKTRHLKTPLKLTKLSFGEIQKGKKTQVCNRSLWEGSATAYFASSYWVYSGLAVGAKFLAYWRRVESRMGIRGGKKGRET